MLNETPYYITRDLYLASTLLALRFKKIGVDYQIEGEKNLPVGYFKFEDSPRLREAERKYWQGGLCIEPRTFMTAMRNLKSEVTTVYKNPHSQFNS